MPTHAHNRQGGQPSGLRLTEMEDNALQRTSGGPERRASPARRATVVGRPRWAEALAPPSRRRVGHRTCRRSTVAHP